MALNVITWLWGQKYGVADVTRLRKACAEYLRCDHSFHLFTDRPGVSYPSAIAVHAISDPVLCERNCFCRLRMFDPEWQKHYGLDGKIISLDLDLVITGEIDYLFAGDSTFRILQGANASNPCPYNASVMMLRSGHHAEVWNTFSPREALKIPFYEFPDDQGWIHYKLPEVHVWTVGAPSGIYAFQKPGWPAGSMALPEDARIVTFIGHRKPHQFAYLPWMQKYWTAAA